MIPSKATGEKRQLITCPQVGDTGEHQRSLTHTPEWSWYSNVVAKYNSSVSRPMEGHQGNVSEASVA